MESNSPLLIFGGSNLASEIRETADLLGDREIYNVIAEGESCLYSHITDNELEVFIKEHPDSRYILGFSIRKLRERFIGILNKYNLLAENVIAPTAYIAKTAKIGTGNYFGHSAVISSHVEIGDRNVIGFLVGIGHDAVIGNDCIINPGAKISGHCVVGNNCLLGANSFIHQGVKVSEYSIIDAMTYIREDVDTPMICSDRNKKQMRTDNILL
jgi:UDP-3-O-[3-hydroxymyristoyl] glucosamine N-acyltransferase